MENNNINSIKNIFYLNKSFPKSLNLLDNFKFISYGGFILPRIKLDPNFSTLEKMIYAPFEAPHYYNLSNNSDSEDNTNTEIEIQISDEEVEGKIINYENKYYKNIKKTNYGYLLSEIKEFKKKKNLINENIKDFGYISKDNNIVPVPPQSIISLLNNHINSIKNNIENINKIILNNINIISTYNNILIYNNENLTTDENTKQIRIQPTTNIHSIILTNNIINNEKEKIKINTNEFSEKSISKPLFEISSESIKGNNKKYIKRGRKGKNNIHKNNRIHSASDDDNLIRKIQVHFLSFIIFFVNDIIKTFINIKNPPLFKNLDYNIKKIVNYKYFEYLKSRKISEIIQLAVSPKMKVHDETVNKKIYNKICNMCPFIAQFLQQSYLSIFNIYYYNKNNKFEIDGKEVQLSLKTKTFNSLIEKYNNLKDKLKYIAIKFFMNSKKHTQIKKFKTNIFNTY